jgi:hypothetical protein
MPVLDRVKDFATLIADRADETGFAALRPQSARADRSERPISSRAWSAFSGDASHGARLAANLPSASTTSNACPE